LKRQIFICDSSHKTYVISTPDYSGPTGGEVEKSQTHDFDNVIWDLSAS